MSLMTRLVVPVRTTFEDGPLLLLYMLLALGALFVGVAIGVGGVVALGLAGLVLVVALGVVVLSRFQHQLLFAFFFLLPFYPLSLFALERTLGFPDGDGSPFRVLRDLMAILLLAMIYSYHLIYKRRLPFQPNLVDGLILLLLGLGVLYIIPASSTTVGILGFRENYVYFLFYFIGRATIFSEKEWRQFLWLLSISGVIAALFALYQLFVLGVNWLARYREIATLFVWSLSSIQANYLVQRGVGTFASPNELGGYLSILIVTLLALLTYDRVRLGPRTWPVWGAIVIMFAGVVITYSRTSWIALAIALAALFWHRRWYFLTLGAIGAVLAIIIKPELILFAFQTITLTEHSASYHRDTFLKSIPYLLNHFYGVGLGAAGLVNDRFADGEGVHFEGFYFNLTAEAGIWSVIVLWSIFAAQWRLLSIAMAQAVSPLAHRLLAAFRALVIAMAATGFFLLLMISREVAFLFWFLMGTSLHLKRLSAPASPPAGPV